MNNGIVIITYICIYREFISMNSELNRGLTIDRCWDRNGSSCAGIAVTQCERKFLQPFRTLISVAVMKNDVVRGAAG